MPNIAFPSLANDLFANRLAESDLPGITAHLPIVDEQTLYTLIQQADSASRTHPRQGWAMMTVIDAAAAHTTSPRIQALAAWHLGRLANEYARLRQSCNALARARHLFTELNEPGWLAACTWQENVLPWASTNRTQSLTQLQNALTDLENGGEMFAPFVPQCRLALAIAQLMGGDLAAARHNIEVCEQVFLASQDRFHLGRCLLVKINIGRRSGETKSVTDWIDEALTLMAPWPAEKAKIGLQQGYFQWLNQGDYSGAIATFTTVIAAFIALDMPIWTAQAQDGLAQIYIITGQLQEVEPLLQQALSQATLYESIGIQADILLDLGWYETQRGNPALALEHFRSAEQLYTQISHHGMRAAALMHLSDAYTQLGRYQLALQTLEKSHDQFKRFNNASRLAECELRLAHIWYQLGQMQMTHLYLNQAGEHAQQANHPTIWPYLYRYRALAHIRQSQISAALSNLEEGLQAAQQQNDPHSIALMQRVLGETWLVQEKPDEAFPHLDNAITSFRAMGMTLDEMLCQIHLGYYHWNKGDIYRARRAWEKLLNWSLETLPNINWQAAAGLAHLAEIQADHHTALTYYHQVRKALSRLRQGFWQPELVGEFNQRLTTTLDRAVFLAAQIGTSQDVLSFIEENKARLSIQPIQSRSTAFSSEMQTSLGQIRWLQQQLHTTPESNRSRWPNPLKRQLKEQIKVYSEIRGRWQRDQQEGDGVLLERSFDQNEFGQKATEMLGLDWVALDYYMTEDRVCVVVITPERSYTWSKQWSRQAYRALLDMVRYGWEADEPESTRLLHLLGEFLLPPDVVAQLRPTTTLIIAPHRQLHYLPWAALHLQGHPLVMACIPVLTLSLSSLLQLWSRPRLHTSRLASGLLLSLSTFPDHRKPLPEVAQETAWVRPHLQHNSLALSETEATWANFLALGQAEGLARFSFWHVASHAFHEPISGRLSGISFYDRDVWLDELWQCAPLPQLVTLSACSGSKSKLYEGDEHIGLATTCLAAGAVTVVGSLWPVLDATMPLLMRDFYEALARGKTAALALALAQRQAWEQGKSWRLWGGLTCTGAPG